jgi:hypothetical protein
MASAATAARHAHRAGLAREAQRVWGALLIWASVVALSIATAGEDVRTFTTPASVASDLVWAAWCLMLGAAVRAAGAPDATWLRGLALAWLLLNVVVRLAPLPFVASLGGIVLVAVSVAAVVVPFGAASVDAHRLWRATRDAQHAVPAQRDATATGDEPWRP